MQNTPTSTENTVSHFSLDRDDLACACFQHALDLALKSHFSLALEEASSVQTRQSQAMWRVSWFNQISLIELLHSVCDPSTDYIYFTSSDPNGRLITSAPGVSIQNEAYTEGQNAGNAFPNIGSIWNCAGLCHKATGCSAWTYQINNYKKCKLFDSKVNKNSVYVPGQGGASGGNPPMFVSGDISCGGMSPISPGVTRTSLLFQASKSF